MNIISSGKRRHKKLLTESVVAKERGYNSITKVANGRETNTNLMGVIIKTITVITLGPVFKRGKTSGYDTKKCGWNNTHTSGFHDKWKRDLSDFCLTVDHDYWKLSVTATRKYNTSRLSVGVGTQYRLNSQHTSAISE